LLSIFNKPQRKPPTVPTTFYHPDPDRAYAAGEGISTKHPSIQAQYASYIPTTHPDIDRLLTYPAANPLPTWHPPPSEFNKPGQEPTLTVPVSFYHPRIELVYDKGLNVSNTHPDLQPLFAPVLPRTHPPLMELLGEPAAYGARS
jgi:hypothetical protein